MLFTTANTNCRDVAQLQKDLIGNEGFCGLPCCQSRTHAWVCPWEAESITSLGLTLGVEVFYIRQTEIFNSAWMYVCAQGKREEFVSYLEKHPITRISFLGKVSSTLWFTVRVLNKADLQECVCRSAHCAREDALPSQQSQITETDLPSGLKNQNLILISSFLSQDVYWYFRFYIFLLISSTKRTDF